jgi:Protein of unknown function (DUF4197)
MQRRQFTVGTVGAAIGGGMPLCLALWTGPLQAQTLSSADAASGIRVALERGAVAAVSALGRQGGFLDDPRVRIPLPGFLNDAAKLLKATGQSAKVDELVAAMNRAAERAVPEARQMLVAAAKGITAQDAVAIVRGGDTSVTDYFSGKTREPLNAQFLPIVTQATQKVDLAERYNAVAGKAAGMGLLKRKDANLQAYVTGKALDGLYFMIGEEEKKICRDQVGAGSDILRKVFGR